MLRRKYASLYRTARARRASVGTLNAFVNGLRSGDVVIVPSLTDTHVVYVGRIRGNYLYSPADRAAGFPHQRKIDWLNEKNSIARSRFSPAVRRFLKAQQPLIKIAGVVGHDFERLAVSDRGPTERSLRYDKADTDTDSIGSMEGKQHRRSALVSARDTKLRKRKIEEALTKNGNRLVCEVRGCGFDFEDTYGKLGAGYAHVHHCNPFGKRKGTREMLTPLSELRILCANCHAMVHRYGECRLVEALKIHR